MFIEVTGKDKMLEDLERLKGLIREAESILHQLPFRIGLSIEESILTSEGSKDNE